MAEYALINGSGAWYAGTADKAPVWGPPWGAARFRKKASAATRAKGIEADGTAVEIVPAPAKAKP